MKVERVCSRNMVMVSRSDSIQKAARAMCGMHVGTVLVTELGHGHGEVVGIVTDRDLVLHAVAEGLDPRTVPVEKVMTPVVASVAEDAEVLEALERMRNAGVRRLLVTGADGKPAGVLSLDDVVDALAAELAQASALMRTERERERKEFGGSAS